MRQDSLPLYKILDTSLIFVGCSLAYLVRFQTPILPLYYFLPAITFVFISSFALTITNFYRGDKRWRSWASFQSVMSGLSVAAILTATLLYLTKTGEDYSRIWMISSVLISGTLIMLSRFLLSTFMGISLGSKKIILLGKEDTMHAIIKNLSRAESYNIKVAKTFDPGSYFGDAQQVLLEDVIDYIELHRSGSNTEQAVSEIWITHDIYSQHDADFLSSFFVDTATKVVFVAELPNLESSTMIEYVGGIPTINSDLAFSKRASIMIKSAFDFIVALLLLTLLSPLLLIIALAIKLDSRGPVLYQQHRYGISGGEFEVFKFRTMRVTESAEEFKQATRDDVRVTRVGKFLRQTSLDELPQLINVLMGNMSLVGPRPHPTLLNEEYRAKIRGYMNRHCVKPGITGLAQIRGFRGETSDPQDMENRIRSDLEYVETWSIFLDIKILFLTIFHVLTTKESY